MIPLSPQPEPANFDVLVRTPGRLFLNINPNPTSWKGKDFWRLCLPDLYRSFGGICAYSCHWIPLEEGCATVDHYIPKSVSPDRAYEWPNFRLSCLKMNARKGCYQDVLDPFGIRGQTFIIDFLTMKVKPSPRLSPHIKRSVFATDKRLRLSQGSCIETRIEYLRLYYEGKATIAFLQDKAPFLAYEVQRQRISAKHLKKIFAPPKIIS